MGQRRGSPQFALPLIVLVICCAFPEGGEENVYVCETIPLSVLYCAMQGAVHLTRRTGCVCVSSVSHTALSLLANSSSVYVGLATYGIFNETYGYIHKHNVTMSVDHVAS